MNNVKLAKKDLEVILELSYAHIESDGKLVWDDGDYNGVFSDIKYLSTYGEVYVNGDSVVSSMRKIKKSKADVKTILFRWAHVDGKHGKVIWVSASRVLNAFKEIKEQCLAGNVYLIAGYLYTKEEFL